jgi:hypothetical protein
LLLSLATTTIVTAALAGWIDAQRQSALETERLTQTAQVIGSLAAHAVRDNDTSGAFSAIRSIAQMSHVSYARIVGPGERLLAETGSGVRLKSDARIDPRLGAGLWKVLNSGTLQVSAPIFSEGERVGEITLLSETPGLRARILGAVLVSLAGAGVVSAGGPSAIQAAWGRLKASPSTSNESSQRAGNPGVRLTKRRPKSSRNRPLE